MAETFSPVRPRARRGIGSFVSAIKTCGLAVPKTAAAAADFTNERLLITASLWYAGATWLVSSLTMQSSVPQRPVRRGIRVGELSCAVVLNVLGLREVVVDGGKILRAMASPNRQTIDFLREIRQRHRHARLISADRDQVQVLLQPAHREVCWLVIALFDSLAFGSEEWSGCRPA